MGTDIHWVLERQHPDQMWHAVASKTKVGQSVEAHLLIKQMDHEWYAKAPERQLGIRDYDVFEILSGAQFNDKSGQLQIAHPGLPENASDHAKLELSAEDDIHSVGHFDLARFRYFLERGNDNIFKQWDDDPTATPEVLHSELRRRFEAVLALLDDSNHAGEILIGPARADDLTPFPTLKDESNHARLLRQRCFNTLLPICDATVRVLIGYDN